MHRSLMGAAIVLASISSHGETPPRGAPPEVIASETCQEFFSNRATANYPKTAVKEHRSGYLVAKYRLDGSGKARDIVVVESVPPGVFDAAAIGALERSSFKSGAIAKECRYVADFASVRRSAP
jgi:outer membrane biosynthesis protein TonB